MEIINDEPEFLNNYHMIARSYG